MPALVLALCTTACTRPAARTEVTVLAASSLTEAFESLERQFEANHEGVDLVVSTAGSQALRLQLEQGAPADVFASANEAHTSALEKAGLVQRSRAFATNSLVLVVPRANPAGLTSFADLPKAARVVLGAEGVPVGDYAEQVLDTAGSEFAAQVRAHVVSRESNVRQVLAKVELGEADAALVYRTDAPPSRAVKVIELPPALQRPATYTLAVVASSRHPELAQAFADLVVSPAGQRTLAEAGFTRVEPQP